MPSHFYFSNLQVLQLAHLNLADNLMGKIPFVPLSHVKSLKSLDMSNNRIIKIEGKVIPNINTFDQRYMNEIFSK